MATTRNVTMKIQEIPLLDHFDAFSTGKRRQCYCQCDNRHGISHVCPKLQTNVQLDIATPVI